MQHSIAPSQPLTDDPLQILGLRDINPGTWSGSQGWSKQSHGPLIDSINPATGRRLAQVRGATLEDYEQVMSTAVAAAAAWRQVPAPKRGEAVRLMGEELRRYKDALGSLVSMENGKIKAEGDGEVQEMIDIADFAVGQSRMLYGLTMHSERPQHRMYEQWHPLGIVGVISAFNFPVAVWSWNAFLAAISGNATMWKPSPKTALCSLAVQHICNRVLERHALPPIFQIFIDAGNDLARAFRRRPPRRAGVLHRLDPLGRRIGASCRAARQESARVGRQQRHHRRRQRQPRPGGARDRIRRGRNRGQRCTTTRRVLVHRSRAAELERRLVAAYAQVRIGDPLNGDTLMGPLIDAGAVSRYSAADCRGHRPKAANCCAAAKCWLGRATSSSRPSFAPMPDGRWSSRNICSDPIPDCLSTPWTRRLRIQNSVPHGLSSAMFTDRLQSAGALLIRRRQRLRHCQRQLGTSGAEIGGAFGGEKDTGGGREPDRIPGSLHAAPDQHHQLEFASCRSPRESASTFDRLPHFGGARLQLRRRNRTQGLEFREYSHTRYSSIQFCRSSSSGIQRSSAPTLSRQRPVSLRPAAKFADDVRRSDARAAARCQRRASAFK